MRGCYLFAFALAACGTPTDADDDVTDDSLWQLEELADSDGFSLRVPEFTLDAGRESQKCFFVRVPDINNGGPVLINRVLTAINPGSHHMNVFRVRTIVNMDPAQGEPTMLGKYPATVIDGEDFYQTSPCWDSANWGDWPLVANSQHAALDNPYTDWQLPSGVAIFLQPGEMLMVQTHYVNTTDQPTPFGAAVGINFYSYKEWAPPQELGTLFATQQEIRICQSTPTVTYSGTCGLGSAATIIAANGHFHKRGKEFLISSWDGQSITHPDLSAQFYASDSWNEPPMSINLAVPIQAGGGIWWDCKYQWSAPTVSTCADVNAKDPLQQGDCCYNFGGNTDIGEHCNVFLYYYPRQTTDVFCN